MLSEQKFIWIFTLLSIASFITLMEAPSPLGYYTLPVPGLLLLYFWFQNQGWMYRLFSIAWIGYVITDASYVIHHSFSSILSSLLSILTIIFTIAGFLTWRNGYIKKRAYIGLIAVAYGAGYFQLIHDAIPKELLAPIAVYAVFDAVIFIVVAGLNLKNSFSYMLCLFGVSTFLISDALYAFHFFVEPLEYGEPIMSILHNLSRLLFILGILQENKSVVPSHQ